MNRRVKLFSALGAAAVLALAACSSSKSSNSGAASGGGGSAAASNVATGSTITIGAQAPMSGATAFPQSGYGAQAGEWYVNNVMGGINGHKLKLDMCASDGSPQTSVNCANGFVSNNYPVVVDTYDSTMGSDKPILQSAKIPVVGVLAGSGLMDQLPYGLGFYLTGPTGVSAVGSMTILQKQGTKNADLAIFDSTATHDYVDQLIQPIAKKLGISMTVQYVDTTSANYTVTAAAQLQNKPDMTGIIAMPESGCTSLFQAERQQGYTGKIFAGSCSEFVATMKDQAAGAYIQPRLYLPASAPTAPPAIKTQIAAYENAMAKIGHTKDVSARSLYSFVSVVTTAQVLATIKGDITASAVSTAFEGLKDFQLFAGGKVTCDGQQWPKLATACSKQAIYFAVQKDGSLAVQDGGYFDLDPTLAG